MAEPRASMVRAGSDAFRHLLEAVFHTSEASMALDSSMHPSEDRGDRRDYRALVQVVQDGLSRGLADPDQSRREGFLRALTDLLCEKADGYPHCAEDWDPIRNTAWAFGEVESHG